MTAFCTKAPPFSWRMAVSLFGAIIVAFSVSTTTAVAQDGGGVTVTDGCMDDLFPGNLGCTANDVRVSGVADVTGDGLVNEDDITFAPVCDAGALNAGASCAASAGGASVCMDHSGSPAPELCGDRCAYPGDTTSFAATFEVELSAQERYDIGLYFATDGDPNLDGALTGSCSISTLPETGTFTRPDGTTGNFVDLDSTCTGKDCPQPDDLCGDVNDDNNPLFYDLSSNMNYITATCVDTDGNGKLNLPNCTSWRQSGANELCTDPTDAYPGSPSKCNCDPTFEVPINVPAAELLVVKTATPTSFNEPSASVQFDVAVTNTGIDTNNDVTLNSLSDDIYGDITQVQGDIISTTCVVPQTLTGNGGTYTCSFTATVSGNGGDTETDTVTASGIDDRGNSISGDDDATVTIVDVLPAIDVTKTANPTSVQEGAGTSVTFSIVVDNDSTADALTLVSLFDDIHGDLNGQGTCATGGSIAIGGSYSCSFSAVVDGPAFSSETDTVTAVGIDNEYVDDANTPNNKVTATDTATVTITDNVASISLTKTANPTAVNEPGDDVDFSIVINNLSSVDSVTINSLSDTIYGNLTALFGSTCTLPQTILPGGSYSCGFSAFVAGNAGDSETNVATAMGVDDDGQPVMASDDATVEILNVPPAASLTKTATSVVVTYTVYVSNDSGAESLTIDSLLDDKFGDITSLSTVVLNTTCSTGIVLTPNDGSPGGTDEYTCTFDGKVTDSPHTNTVTGTVSDDDGGSVTPSDDATVSFQ